MTNKERFKANIRMVELEQHSYCNRKCWFCPNQLIDRQGPSQDMNLGVYLQILEDLASINYDQIISFSGNCEPFSHPFFTAKVAYARDYLSDACLMTNTNTDYLTTELVLEASMAGLNMIKAQLYFGKNELYTDDAIHSKMEVLKNKLPGIKFSEKEPNKWFALIRDMVIVAYAKNWLKVGHNRCDCEVRPPQKRYHTCGEPIQYIGVNYAGQVSPCCNIRPDYEPYKHLILGQMDKNPGRLFEFYKGTLLPETEYPCSTCMGKQWHPNGKIVYKEILSEMKKCQTVSAQN